MVQVWGRTTYRFDGHQIVMIMTKLLSLSRQAEDANEHAQSECHHWSLLLIEAIDDSVDKTDICYNSTLPY